MLICPRIAGLRKWCLRLWRRYAQDWTGSMSKSICLKTSKTSRIGSRLRDLLGRLKPRWMKWIKIVHELVQMHPLIWTWLHRSRLQSRMLRLRSHRNRLRCKMRLEINRLKIRQCKPTIKKLMLNSLMNLCKRIRFLIKIRARIWALIRVQASLLCS